MYQNTFKRKEIKYLATTNQIESFLTIIENQVKPDNFFKSSISNIYYDTPDFLLIRTSLQKPKYKEKLRVRSYNTPRGNSNVFLEIKKKCNGIVYKRRDSMQYDKALSFLADDNRKAETQVQRELAYMCERYQNLSPAMMISYKRASYQGIEDSSVRITIDRDIFWRTNALDLKLGPWGNPVIDRSQRLMEIKITNAMPLWLAHALSACHIYPTSFSKYGRAYQQSICQIGEECVKYA